MKGKEIRVSTKVSLLMDFKSGDLVKKKTNKQGEVEVEGDEPADEII